MSDQKGGNDKSKEKTKFDLLHDAFPGRSDAEVVGIGLLYAGVRWGRDFRAAHMPRDAAGRLLFDERDEKQLRERYDPWLSDYLRTLDLTPSQEQAGLCKYVERMQPQEAMIMLGMNAALYQLDIESIEEKMLYPDAYVGELSDYGTPEQIEQVKSELAERQRLCPDSTLTDLGYRIPLAVAMRNVADQVERIRLLNVFYANYSQYIYK